MLAAKPPKGVKIFAAKPPKGVKMIAAKPPKGVKMLAAKPPSQKRPDAGKRGKGQGRHKVEDWQVQGRSRQKVKD